MKLHRFGIGRLALLATLMSAGCTAKHSDNTKVAHAEHKDEAPSGASYKAGKGVLVKHETKRLLGLETAEVSEKAVPSRVEFTTQTFRVGNLGSSQQWMATGTLATSRLSGVHVGQEIALRAGNGTSFNGRLVKLDESLDRARDEVAAVVSFAWPTTNTQPALFLQATITLPEAERSLAVPHTAVLRTAEGSFVFAVNGEAYQRTAVKIGAAADGWVAIADGLLEGDSVVTKAVESLYLVELRATKGGGGCH